ncbi:MAG: hypothetical protein Q4G27_04265 [Flavobacteriaceae bacterium]|nr:hypothetical protein [Flavobacteriaceae bacterium]
MKSIITLFSLFLFLFSCDKKETHVNSSTEIAGDQEKIGDSESIDTYEQCLLYAYNKDSAFLQLRFEGKKFSGRLIHSNFQKDGSFGYYSGEMQGDTLFGNYKMMSEGMVSVTEKIYLKRGNTLSEGFGPIKEGANVNEVLFVSYDSIQFGLMKDLEPVDCYDGFISHEYDEYWQNIK